MYGVEPVYTPLKDPYFFIQMVKKYFFHGGHTILSEKLVSYVEVYPRGPKNKHFFKNVNNSFF